MRRLLTRFALTMTGFTGVAASCATGLEARPRHATQAAPASVQQIMLLVIDPAADALWASVGTSQTARGLRVHQPRRAADWAKVTGYAQSLVVGAKHLQTTDLPVGANSHSRLADADTPGTRTAMQIRADIDADSARFRSAAVLLENVANSALTAARNHDPHGVLEAGEALDAACESCHSAYWYPRTLQQRLPSAEDFARLTNRVSQ